MQSIQAEKRLNPRVITDIPVSVGLPAENNCGRIVNISIDGIAIQCDLEMAEKLKQNPSDPRYSGEHQVSFSLPDNDLSLLCRVVHVRRLSQKSFEVGLRFISIEHSDRMTLLNFVNDQLY